MKALLTIMAVLLGTHAHALDYKDQYLLEKQIERQKQSENANERKVQLEREFQATLPQYVNLLLPAAILTMWPDFRLSTGNTSLQAQLQQQGTIEIVKFSRNESVHIRYFTHYKNSICAINLYKPYESIAVGGYAEVDCPNNNQLKSFVKFTDSAFTTQFLTLQRQQR